MKTQKIVLMLGIGTLLALNFSTQAADQTSSPSLSLLKSVPLAELPGKAAALVAAANADSRIQTTVDVVKAAVGLNPASAPAVVGCIAASSPEVAAIAAATAASLVPKQAAILAQTAAAAAPKQAGKIVEAVCRAVPDAFKAVAQAVAEAVPGASKEILAGVASAVPSLKDAINNALATYNNGTPSVSMVMTQVTSSSGAAVTLASGLPTSTTVAPNLNPPPVQPPYQPRSGSPTDLDPGSGTPVTGSRGYSAPPPP